MEGFINPHCNECQKNKYHYRQNNLCTISNASDEHPARCASFWAEEKVKIVDDYSGILTKGMKHRFNEINYIDLYCGPGYYFDRKTGDEKRSPVFMALKYNYSNIFLNDLNNDCYRAIEYRTKNATQNIQIYNEDANDIAEKINKQLSRKSLSFCMLDPSNMSELDFKTIIKLTSNKLVDLLINLPIGMDFKRGSSHTLDKYNRFFNSDKWQIINKQYKNGDIRFWGEKLINLYLDELYKNGYKKPPDKYTNKYVFPVKMEKNVVLYYMIFASKNKKGYEFCEKIRKYIYPQQELL